MIGKSDYFGNYHPINIQKAHELASIGIDNCGFPVRAINILTKLGAKSCLDVALFAEEDLIKENNCGTKTIRDIKKVLRKYGIEEIPVCVYGVDQIDSAIVADNNAHKLIESLEKLKNIKISEIGLSHRARNCCLSQGIETLYDFAFLSKDEALQIPNMGRGTLKEIWFLIEEYGVKCPVPKDIASININPSIKNIGISDESSELLKSKNIMSIEDLKQLNSKTLDLLLKEISDTDRNTIIYILSESVDVILNKDNFDSYLKYSIERICESLSKSDYFILSLLYGLNGNKIWPIEVIASTLNVEETSIKEQNDNIIDIFSCGKNLKRIMPAINYYEQCNVYDLNNSGYVLMLNSIIERTKKNNDAI